MSVVTNAIPMSPPMLRDRFMMPLTWLFFCGGDPGVRDGLDGHEEECQARHLDRAQHDGGTEIHLQVELVGHVEERAGSG